MALIEVDESELGNLRRIRETVAKIAAVPEGKRLIQKAHKLVDPNAATPDLDADELKAKADGEWQKKFDELQAKIEADKAEREKTDKLALLNAKMEAGRKALKDAGWTEEGIKGVEKLMEDKGILDHEIAAAYIERQNPPREVMNPRAFGGFNFVEQPKEEDAFLKALLDSKGDDDNAVLKAAVDAVGEIRHGARGR